LTKKNNSLFSWRDSKIILEEVKGVVGNEWINNHLLTDYRFLNWLLGGCSLLSRLVVWIGRRVTGDAPYSPFFPVPPTVK